VLYAAPHVGRDTERLDHIQTRRATIELVPDGYGDDGSMFFAFRVGGLHRGVSRDVREAIDAAIGLDTKEAGHADPT
jgi:cobalamin biosynthesis protein CobD/CbiB